MDETTRLGLVLPTLSDWADVEILNENFKKLDGAVNQAQQAVAGEYDPLATHAKGDYCTRDGTLYQCIVDIAAPEEWNGEHWRETSIDAELKMLAEQGTPECVVVSVPTGGWALTDGCYQQTVAVEGLLASDDQATVRIEPVGSTDAAAQLTTDTAYSLWAAAGGYAACTADGALFCRCPAGGVKPAVDFQIAVCIAR